MGGGSWSYSDFDSYTTKTKGVSASTYSSLGHIDTQEVFKARKLSPMLDPFKIMRECKDSEEHPNTLPVILALDVTGSMGSAATKVAQKLNDIISDLYADTEVPDVEFCVMGIGDLYCDAYPVQISQFESDIRIAEQLDAIIFEGGGGGNSYESYSAAWYMGLRHCDLDCWNRGQKGIIITMGDELPNPYLNASELSGVTGDTVQSDVETKLLLEEAKEKFDIFHLSVADESSCYEWHNSGNKLDNAWIDLLGKENYKVVTLNDLAATIVKIVKTRLANVEATVTIDQNDVSWADL